MTRNSDNGFQLQRSRARNGSAIALTPPAAPLVDGPRRNRRPLCAQSRGQLWPAPGRLDRSCDWVVHAPNFGTENSKSQGAAPAESSETLRHAGSMNTKVEFSRRFSAALDAAGVDTHPASRKRWIHKKFGVTERQAGNYLNGQQLPTCDGMMQIALETGVSWEWLTTGRGPMRPLPLTEEQAALLGSMSRDDIDRLCGIARLLPSAAQPTA